MSAVDVNTFSATGAFRIHAVPRGQINNVNIGSATQTLNQRGSIYANTLNGISASISHISASTTTTNKLATFAGGNWQFRDTTQGGYLLEGNHLATFTLGSSGNPSIVLNSNPAFASTFSKINVNATAQFTYLCRFTTLSIPHFSIDLSAGLIYNLSSATTTLGAVNKGQLDTQINIVDTAKYDKTGGS